MRLNIEPYLNENKNLSEFEKQLLEDDDNYLLKKIRPISFKNISKIPNKNLLNFIDDLNIKINKVLYSSVANKYNKKTERKKGKEKKKKINNKLNKSAEEPTTSSLYFKREKAFMLEKIRKNINEFKNEKNKKWKFLKEKNRVFRQNLINSNNEQIEKYYESMNEKRIKSFSRTLNKCMSDRILKKDKFKLPNIKLNIKNVYSRLYHNSVFLREREDNNQSLNYSNVSNNNSFNESENQNYYKKEKKFRINKIIKNSQGKEFTIKITPEIKRKCFFNYSGGPIKNYNYYEEDILKDEEKTKYLITLNRLNDENGNNNLQIAVKKNLIDFVKYFLNKKIDIDYQNKFGDTALHIAMIENNLDIIEILLDNNANLLIKNNEGKTPFDLASDKAKKEFRLEAMIMEKNKSK